MAEFSQASLTVQEQVVFGLKLERFRIRTFRSIIDSGWVDVEKVTILVGANESGKTNILEALETIKSIPKIPLSIESDYPRRLSRSEFDHETDTVEAFFTFTASEKKELIEIWPSAKSATGVYIIRRYHESKSDDITTWFRFEGAASERPDDKPQRMFRAKAQALFASLNQSAKRTPAAQHLKTLLEFHDPEDLGEWREKAKSVVRDINTFISEQAIPHTNASRKNAEDLAEIAESADDWKARFSKAGSAAIRMAPNFLYYDAYPDIPGSVSIADYVARLNSDDRYAADEAFDDFLLVAGVDIQRLIELEKTDPRVRKRIADDAGIQVSRRLREFWRQSKLRVRIDVDGDAFDIFIKDDAEEYPCEINLGSRSKGFQWFFGFLVTALAETIRQKGRHASIFLLDEAGLHLHPAAQKDLLSLLESLKSQVILSTHLPFMIPINTPKAVRGVKYEHASGTTVIEDLEEHAPLSDMLKALLGYETAGLFLLNQKDLLTEGITDYWLIKAISSVMNATTGKGLDPEIAVTPCNGMAKTPAFVSLLISHGIATAVLLDSSAESHAFASAELIKSKFIAKDAVLFAGHYLAVASNDADIEDLFPEDSYDQCVKDTHHLDGITLQLNNSIPRIAKRYESALRAVNLTFDKKRTAKRLSEKIERRSITLPKETLESFGRLFRDVENALEAHAGRKQFK